MADHTGRYYQIALDGVDTEHLTSRHRFKAGIAVISGSCLVLMSIVATFVSNPRLHNTSAAEATSLFRLPNSMGKNGLALSQQSPWNVNNMNNQGKIRGSVQAKVQAKDDATDVKQPWDIGRFARTAGEFGFLQPPNPIKVLGGILGGSNAMSGQTIKPEQILYNPVINPLQLVFRPLDDVVMGGSSESSFDDATGVWSGKVITAGGGFAGIRTRPFEPPLDLSRCTGLRLKVKGQGQRFKFIVRDNDEFNGIAWSYSFDTNPWFDTEVRIPLADFVPTKFARVVEDVGNLDTSTISALQITYSKFEYQDALNPKFEGGDFKLVLKELDTY